MIKLEVRPEVDEEEIETGKFLVCDANEVVYSDVFATEEEATEEMKRIQINLDRWDKISNDYLAWEEGYAKANNFSRQEIRETLANGPVGEEAID